MAMSTHKRTKAITGRPRFRVRRLLDLIMGITMRRHLPRGPTKATRTPETGTSYVHVFFFEEDMRLIGMSEDSDI